MMIINEINVRAELVCCCFEVGNGAGLRSLECHTSTISTLVNACMEITYPYPPTILAISPSTT